MVITCLTTAAVVVTLWIDVQLWMRGKRPFWSSSPRLRNTGSVVVSVSVSPLQDQDPLVQASTVRPQYGKLSSWFAPIDRAAFKINEEIIYICVRIQLRADISLQRIFTKVYDRKILKVYIEKLSWDEEHRGQRG